VRIAYADPPYIGHYGSEEVNHSELISSLVLYDAWALSASSPSLRQILPICPDGTRVGVWVKPFCSFKPGVNPAYAWEPVLFWGGRKRSRAEPTVRDFVSCNITLKRGLCGAKPEAFCFWLFELLGMTAVDEFYDLFPGTGAVTEAWQRWRKA
jgi:hypothetical protein